MGSRDDLWDTAPRLAPAPPALSRLRAPRLRNSPEIPGKPHACPCTIPECEHRGDWVAEGAVSSEPVSPRIRANARGLLHPRLRRPSDNDKAGVRRDGSLTYVPETPGAHPTISRHIPVYPGISRILFLVRGAAGPCAWPAIKSFDPGYSGT